MKLEPIKMMMMMLNQMKPTNRTMTPTLKKLPTSPLRLMAMTPSPKKMPMNPKKLKLPTSLRKITRAKLKMMKNQ